MGLDTSRFTPDAIGFLPQLIAKQHSAAKDLAVISVTVVTSLGIDCCRSKVEKKRVISQNKYEGKKTYYTCAEMWSFIVTRNTIYYTKHMSTWFIGKHSSELPLWIPFYQSDTDMINTPWYDNIMIFRCQYTNTLIISAYMYTNRWGNQSRSICVCACVHDKREWYLDALSNPVQKHSTVVLGTD